jgi:hypothetical protein
LLDGNEDVRAQYLSDGLHLNSLGNQKVFEGVMDCLQQHFPQVLPKASTSVESQINPYLSETGVAMVGRQWQELVGLPLP